MPLEHIHPMIVHFPIVLVVLALLADIANMLCRRSSGLRNSLSASGMLFAAGAGLMAILAFVFGDMAYDIAVERGISADLLETHEGWGTMTAAVVAVIAAIRVVMWWRQVPSVGAYRPIAVALSLVAVVMVLGTAYYGGDLVYGHGVNVMPAAQ